MAEMSNRVVLFGYDHLKGPYGGVAIYCRTTTEEYRQSAVKAATRRDVRVSWEELSVGVKANRKADGAISTMCTVSGRKAWTLRLIMYRFRVGRLRPRYADGRNT